MNKRLVVIIIILIVILSGIAGLLYYAVQKQKESKIEPQKTVEIKTIVDQALISPVASLDSNGIWYFTDEGRLFRVDADGSDVSEYPLPSLGNPLRFSLWPNSGSDFLAISRNGKDDLKSFYDSEKKIYIHLPNNIRWIDWMPDNKRVLYIWKSDNGQSLVQANADGTGFKAIKSVFWPDLAVKVSPDGKTALLYRTASEGDNNKIYAINLESGEMTTVIAEGKNTAAIWLPSGNKFLFTQATAGLPKLYLADFANKNTGYLNLQTSLDKIVVSSDSKLLYAAVPKDLNAGDNFIKMDLSSLNKEKYFEPTTEIRAKNLILLGNALYFVNSRDNKLYQIVK